MALLDRQKAGVTLGSIRLGQKVVVNGKERPERLSTFRLTAPVRERIEAAANLFGGEVREWRPRDGAGVQWEVVTERDVLPVTVPPGDAVEQWYMLFGGRPVVRQRLCDGFAERLRGVPCLCPSDLLDRKRAASDGNACWPTTQVRLILADLPGLGVWQLTSRGDSAADELGRTAMMLQEQAANDIYLPAALRLELRRSVGAGEVHQYPVPVLDVGVSLAELAAGTFRSGLALDAGSGQRALPAAPAAPGAPPEGPAWASAQQLWDAARHSTDAREVWRMGKDADARGWLGETVWDEHVGEELGEALRARIEILTAPDAP
jgi:hypothetical protein